MKKEHAKQRKRHSFIHLCSTNLLTIYTSLDYCSKYYDEYCNITEKKKNIAPAILEFTRAKVVGREMTCWDHAKAQAQRTRSEGISCTGKAGEERTHSIRILLGQAKALN